MVDTPSKISSDDPGLSGTEAVRRRDDPNGVNAIGVKCGNGETIISIGRLGRKNETLPENRTGIRTFSKTDSKYTWMIIFDKNFQNQKNLKLDLPGKSRASGKLGLSLAVWIEQIFIKAPINITRASAISKTAHLYHEFIIFQYTVLS